MFLRQWTSNTGNNQRSNTFFIFTHLCTLSKAVITIIKIKYQILTKSNITQRHNLPMGFSWETKIFVRRHCSNYSLFGWVQLYWDTAQSSAHHLHLAVTFCTCTTALFSCCSFIGFNYRFCHDVLNKQLLKFKSG